MSTAGDTSDEELTSSVTDTASFKASVLRGLTFSAPAVSTAAARYVHIGTYNKSPSEPSYRWCLSPSDNGCDLNGSDHRQTSMSGMLAILPPTAVLPRLISRRVRLDDGEPLGLAPQGFHDCLERPPRA